MPTLAAYARVSTQRQAQAHTTEQQLERLRAYAQAQGWGLPAGLSQTRGVYPALRMRAACAPPTSEVAHDPERPCREAEAPVQARLTWGRSCQSSVMDSSNSQFGLKG